MALEPITRQEKIIAGQDLTPITRLEMFLKNFGGGGGGSGGGLFVVTVSADESGHFIADHYWGDIAAAFKRGEMPVVKTTGYDNTQIFTLHMLSDGVALFHYVSLAGNPENADVSIVQCNIGEGTVVVSSRYITANNNP